MLASSTFTHMKEQMLDDFTENFMGLFCVKILSESLKWFYAGINNACDQQEIPSKK